MSSIAIFRATARWKSGRRPNSSRSRSACAPACAQDTPMMSSTLALRSRMPAALAHHPLVERYAPLVTTVLALVVIWYVAAIAMNSRIVVDGFEREETPYSVTDVISGTMDAERPLLPAPHQIVSTFLDSVFGYPPLAPRSLVYHSL